eukprot:358547-Chlamydomonas_euryale.AAC.2
MVTRRFGLNAEVGANGGGGGINIERDFAKDTPRAEVRVDAGRTYSHSTVSGTFLMVSGSKTDLAAPTWVFQNVPVVHMTELVIRMDENAISSLVWRGRGNQD